MTKQLVPGVPASATIRGEATQKIRTDGGRIRDSKNLDDNIEFPFDIGDGRGNVSVTRGFKNWFSTRDAGLTVESTVTVSVACNQDIHSILASIDQAAIVAEGKAKEGAEEMGAYLQDFAKR